MANFQNKNQKNAWVLSQVTGDIIAMSSSIEDIIARCRGNVKYYPSDRDSNRYLRLQNRKRGVVSPNRVPQSK